MENLKISIFIFALLFFGCRKSNAPVTLPAATQTGANTFGANINGVAWHQQSSAATLNIFYHNFEQHFLFLQGNGQNATLKLYVGPITHTGTYNIQANGDANDAGEYDSSGSQAIYQTNSTYGGTITITKLDPASKIISGTFSLDAENVRLPGDVVHVTDGRFDVTYY